MSATDSLPVPAKRGRPLKGHEKIDIPEALKLRLRGWTFEQLAERYHCHKSNVARALDTFTKLIPNPEHRTAYQQSKADVLESVQLQMIASLLHPAKIQKATLGNMAYAASKLDEMIRLDRGQSTSNVNVLSAIIDTSHGQLFKKAAVPADPPDSPEVVPAKSAEE